jgi:hypothetical protein
MSPIVTAAVFGLLGLAAIYGIRKNIISGSATSRGWTCSVDDNPVGFCLIVAMKGALVGCAIAEILHAFGLAGDPVAQIQQALPFLASGRVQR